MKIIDFFECTYIVNLPERKDRRKLITTELTKNNMPLTPGKVEIFPAIRPSQAEGFPSLGARGCYLSHFSILKQAKAKGLKNVLFMEDDLKIASNFQQVEEKIVERLSRNDWGFIYLGHQLEGLENGTDGLLPFYKGIKTTHFYGINGTIFDELISFLELVQTRPPGHPDGGPMHVDGAYSTFRSQNPDVLTLVASPNLGLQQPSRSDLHEKWFDRVPVIKQAVDLARIVKRA